MKAQSILLLALVALTACSLFDDAEYADIKELVTRKDEWLVSKDGGEATVRIYANGKVDVTVMNSVGDWAWCDRTFLDGDGDIVVTFDPNDGFRRMVKLQLSLNGGEKLDTVYVRQEGIEPYLECDAPYAIVDGSEEGWTTFSLSTNIPLEEMTSVVDYLSGASDWIARVGADLGELVVQTRPNPGDHISRARVRMDYVDGWEQGYRLDVFITSSDRNGGFGTQISFSDARNYAGQEKVSDEVYIRGVVVSDWHSKNMALNPSVNYDRIDVSQNDRTAYLQSEDGSMGFRLLFENAADNVLVRGTRLSLSLLDARVVREDAPERYTIVALTPSNMVRSEKGTLTEKVRRIASLTAEDLYTYVTIPNTEFVYKTGSYTNVYENYTLSSIVNAMLPGNNNRLDGWACLLMDDSGAAIYAPVNMLCTWRRSGDGVPQGTGDVRGILVHEKNPRYGDQGPFQIRVLDESGFAQDRDGASSYRTFAKWDGSPYHYRYGLYTVINPRYGDPGVGNRNDSIIPSDDISASSPIPVAELTLENKTIGSSAGNYPISSYDAYCSKVVTASGPGNRGIASGDNSDTYPKSLCLNTEIKGWFEWTDERITGYKGLVIETSTKHLTGSLMVFPYSFDVGKISAATSQNYPAHWCVEYSVDGGGSYKVCPDAVTGKDYVHLRSLPWWDTNIGGIKYYTCSSCGLGATEHLSVIPSDVFGKDKVLFRIRPYDDTMAIFPIDWNGSIETATVRHNTTANTVINFENIVIRYK